MSCKLFIWRLRPGSTVKIHNNVKAIVPTPTDNLVKILAAPAGIILIVVNEAFKNPESNRDPYRVQSQARNLLDIRLRSLRFLMFLERLIGCSLTNALNASPFIIVAVTTHALP